MAKPKYALMQVVILSTAHLPEAFPFDDRWFYASLESEVGYFVHCADDPARWATVPWFQKILIWFRENYGDVRGPDNLPIEWIRFDDDGPIVQGLEVFEWDDF